MSKSTISTLSIPAIVSISFLLSISGCKEPKAKAEETGAAVKITAPTPPTTTDAKSPLPPSKIIEGVGFVFPGTVVIDKKRDNYLISNANLRPMENENNGFVSKVSPAGNVVDLKWIEGGKNGVTLISPKGMAIRDDILYIADRTDIHKFGLNDGAPMGSIAVENATFLNDIALAADNTLYVTDTGLTYSMGKLAPNRTDAIYAIDDKEEVTQFVKGESLENPNGIIATPEGLYVASFTGSKLIFVSYKGRISTSASLPGATLDGIAELPNGELLVTSWKTSTVYKGTPDGKFVAFKANLKGPSDLTYDLSRRRVVIPLAKQNALLFQPLDTSKEQDVLLSCGSAIK